MVSIRSSPAIPEAITSGPAYPHFLQDTNRITQRAKETRGREIRYSGGDITRFNGTSLEERNRFSLRETCFPRLRLPPSQQSFIEFAWTLTPRPPPRPERESEEGRKKKQPGVD